MFPVNPGHMRSEPRTLWSVAAFCVALLGAFSARAADPAPVGVAVLPLALLAAPQELGEQMRDQLETAVVEEYDVHLAVRETVDRAVLDRCGEPSRWWDCLGQDRTLFDLAETLGVELLISGKLAAMGDSQVINVRVVDRPAGSIAAESVEISGEETARLGSHFVLLSGRALPRQRRKAAVEAPVLTDSSPGWPLWVGVGVGGLAAVGLIVGAVVVAVALSDAEPSGSWDHRVVLP